MKGHELGEKILSKKEKSDKWEMPKFWTDPMGLQPGWRNKILPILFGEREPMSENGWHYFHGHITLNTNGEPQITEITESVEFSVEILNNQTIQMSKKPKEVSLRPPFDVLMWVTDSDNDLVCERRFTAPEEARAHMRSVLIGLPRGIFSLVLNP